MEEIQLNGEFLGKHPTASASKMWWEKEKYLPAQLRFNV